MQPSEMIVEHLSLSWTTSTLESPPKMEDTVDAMEALSSMDAVSKGIMVEMAVQR